MFALSSVTVLVELVGGASPRRVADSSAAGAGRLFHNGILPSKQNRLGTSGVSRVVSFSVTVLGLVCAPDEG